MSETIHVLLVEDNPADVDLIREGFEESKIYCHLEVARDGIEAMQMLRHEQDLGCVRPDLILLDLNMPRMDGREVLAEIKQDESLKTIPVVIMTSSEAERDIAKCYELHANAFIIKPLGLDQLIEIVTQIEQFWFSVVRLPPKEIS